MKSKLTKEVLISMFIGLVVLGLEIMLLMMLGTRSSALLLMAALVVTALPSILLLRIYKRYDLCAWFAIASCGAMVVFFTAVLLFVPGTMLDYSTVYFLLANWLGAALPCIMGRLLDRDEKFNNFREFFRLISIIFGAVYIFVLFNALFLKHGIPGLRRVSLVPFKTIVPYITGNVIANRSTMVINLLANVMLFIPLGFYLSVIKLKKASYKLWVLLGVPVVIEIIQFLGATGISDIDDVILNLLGGLLGIALHRGIEGIYSAINKTGGRLLEL